MYIMKYFIIVFLLICCSVSSQNQSPEGSFKTIDNFSLNQKVFTVKIMYGSNDFKLQICKIDDCHTSGDCSFDIDSGLLSKGIIDFVITEVDTTVVDSLITPMEKSYLDQLKLKISNYIKEEEEAKKSEELKLIESIQLEGDQYSGKLVLNKEVTCWVTDKNRGKGFRTKVKDLGKRENQTLKVINATVKFFNNKASSIYIKAQIIEDGKNPEKLVFLNNNFSVALRYFNHFGSLTSAQRKDGKWITIDYNDVFDYEADQFYNYSIANDQINLSNEKSNSSTVRIKQRSFFDFFTAVVYSDVLSFNSENSNSLLNAQAKLLVPLNQRNPGKFSFIRQLSASANVALGNSFADDNRYISITNNQSFNHFDLLRKQNINGKMDLQAINLEYKRLFMNISLGYSLAFYRTGFQYIETKDNEKDLVLNKQLLSVGHGPFLNFEIRPQSNFGADIVLSLDNLNYTDTDSIGVRKFKNDIIENAGYDYLGVKYNVINIESNFYWLTSEVKNGGVFARLGAYYHTKSHEIFPQLMVGYATNLTSFVNRFKTNSNGRKQ